MTKQIIMKRDGAKFIVACLDHNGNAHSVTVCNTYKKACWVGLELSDYYQAPAIF